MTNKQTYKSRIKNFYKLPLDVKYKIVHKRYNFISKKEYESLANKKNSTRDTNLMIENSMGFFSMPIGIVLNFIVNNKPVIIPLVVEEPSIIAACSGVAYLVGKSGGVYARSSSSIMIGQINLLNIEKVYKSKLILNINKSNIKKIINNVSKNMVKRGGGCQYLTCKILYMSKDTIHTQYDSKKPSLIIHFYVNCCNAMGANIVNTILENVTYRIKNLLKCDCGIRIISNFSTKRMAKAYCSIPYSQLSNQASESHGIWIAKNIISAYRMSIRDVYRACTHNKGIMNGVDAVAIATGNDWRALESAAHTFASRGSMYTSLTIYVMCKYSLACYIEMPLSAATVGGSTSALNSIKSKRKILGVFSSTSKHLSEVMIAVGLCQNIAALKALSTSGIQKGHMLLHAKQISSSIKCSYVELKYLTYKLVKNNNVNFYYSNVYLYKLKLKKETKPNNVFI